MTAEIVRDPRVAVRSALLDALSKGKLGIVAAMHGMPEGRLRLFAEGADSALSEGDIAWLAVDLRV